MEPMKIDPPRWRKSRTLAGMVVCMLALSQYSGARMGAPEWISMWPSCAMTQNPAVRNSAVQTGEPQVSILAQPGQEKVGRFPWRKGRRFKSAIG